MPEEFENLNSEEKLKAENEFLKMRMMLEHGAKFEEGTKEIPPEMENEFLQYVMAFEKQAANPKYIKLYDKIKRPTHFKPVSTIADEEIEAAWEQLSDYMENYGVSLGVCSPNISVRELYRFTIEELFKEDVNDMTIPGMMTSFTYDEFYPDPYFDNTQAATEDCIKCILQKRPLGWMPHFRKENLTLNNHDQITEEELKNFVNRFKDTYDNLEIIELKETSCIVEGNKSRVDGIYNIAATSSTETVCLSGNWKVDFERDEDLGYWYIYSVEIAGINF
jgi:hypothetical protein